MIELDSLGHINLVVDDIEEATEFYVKLFNAIQIVILFALWPFITQWAKTATFIGAGIVFWIMVVAYCIGFICMIYAVRLSFDK